MSATYIADHQRVVARMLARAGRTITLIPRVKTQTPDGGFEWTEQAPREPQTFRPPRSAADATRREESAGGVQRETHMEIMGAHDAVVEVADVFTLDGESWEVVQLLPATGWDRRAEVVRLG